MTNWQSIVVSLASGVLVGCVGALVFPGEDSAPFVFGAAIAVAVLVRFAMPIKPAKK